LATKCTSCGSVACDRAAAFAARIAADSAFSDAVKARKSVSALYPALKAAEERFSKAWALCAATFDENDRQLGATTAMRSDHALHERCEMTPEQNQCAMCESADCRREAAWICFTESVSAMKQSYSSLSATYMKACLRGFIEEAAACHARIWTAAYSKINSSARAALGDGQ